MLNNIPVTISGNVVADPELKKAGKADVTNFTMAHTPRVKVQGTEDEYEDGDSTFIRVTAWRREAENIVASLKKGDRILVSGDLKFRHYENDKYLDEEDNAAKFISVEIDAREVAVSTSFATVSATKAKKGESNGNSETSEKPAGRRSRKNSSAAPAQDEEF